MRTLVWITGFPRSGTTWLQMQLIKADECEGMECEQGLDLLWRQRLPFAPPIDCDTLIAESASSDPTRQLHIATVNGCNFIKHIQSSPIWTLDSLTRTARQSWLTKSPAMVFDPTFPSEYVEASSQWDRAVVLCCRRDPIKVWQSGLKKWPHWNERMGFARFHDFYNDYYRLAEESGWRIVNHHDMQKDPQSEVNKITYMLGWHNVRVDEFIVRTK